jgi:hypothetical protein
MKSLFAFSSGGGSGFPGSPIGAVYVGGTTPEFLAICAEVITFQGSIVIDGSSGAFFWGAGGVSMYLITGNVQNIAQAPTPGTIDGITFSIDEYVTIYDENTAQFYYYNSPDWVALIPA